MDLTTEYNRRQILDRLKSVSECLRINQYMGSEEGGEEDGEGRNMFRDTAADTMNSLESTLNLAAAEERTGRHHHGGGGGLRDDLGGEGVLDSLRPFSAK